MHSSFNRNLSLGVAQWRLPNWGVDTFSKIKGLGICGLQIAVGTLLESNSLNASIVKEYQNASASTGIKILAVVDNSLNDFSISPLGTANAKIEEEIMSRAIQAAAALRAPLVFFPSFRKRIIRTQLDFLTTAIHFRRLCDVVADQGITIATENSLDAAGNAALYNLVNRPNFKILLDTLNPYLHGHDVGSMISEIFPYIANQVHLKDGNCGASGNVILGQGDANLMQTLSILDSCRFNGIYVLENDYRVEGISRIKDDIKATLKLLSRGIHDLKQFIS